MRKAKPTEKPYKLADGGGLFLLVNPTGSRLWRMKYRIAGREKLLAIGSYPDVSLAKAREQRENARKALVDGADPSAIKKGVRLAAKAAAGTTFRAVAEELLAKLKREGLAPVMLAKRLASGGRLHSVRRLRRRNDNGGRCAEGSPRCRSERSLRIRRAGALCRRFYLPIRHRHAESGK